jgi:CRISPR-associated protein Cmx8
MAKKTKAPAVETLEIDYQLAELPSSQHRAGLARLVLMVKWLERQGTNKGICELKRLDELGATLRINELGLEALFTETYAAFIEEQARPQPFKNKKKEIVPPLREEVRQETDSKSGKTKEKTVYIYPVVIPKGAFLVDLDPSADGNKGVWVKLWRDMIWSIFRGVPATRKPFEDRAEGVCPDDAAKTWNDLAQPLHYSVDLSSTYSIGAQANNAENVPFKDRARFQFLLHFWPFAAQTYVPALINNEGGRDFVGYALAIPDVANLEWFCEELPKALKHNRGVELSGYRPRDCVVDLAVEGALDILSLLRARIAVNEGERATSDLVLGVDVIHVEKQGNNIRLLGTSRLDPRASMIDEYARLRHSLWDPLFRKQRVLNLINERTWYTGFDAVLSRLPYEQSIGNKNFRRDARESFKNEVETMHEETHRQMTAPEELADAEQMDSGSSPDLTFEELIYRLVGTYISRKLKNKYQLEWLSVKSDPKKQGEYEVSKGKIARDAFLSVRSRTGADFAEYFASTLCSVPQHMGEKQFETLALALHNETDKVRTLTMLALSARG